MKILKNVLTKNLECVETLLPACFIVCPNCRGNGTELRGGLKDAVLDEEHTSDPDFLRDYFGGAYDVQCSYCKGNRVVLDVDLDALDKETREDYERFLSDGFPENYCPDDNVKNPIDESNMYPEDSQVEDAEWYRC